MTASLTTCAKNGSTTEQVIENIFADEDSENVIESET